MQSRTAACFLQPCRWAVADRRALYSCSMSFRSMTVGFLHFVAFANRSCHVAACRSTRSTPTAQALCMLSESVRLGCEVSVFLSCVSGNASQDDPFPVSAVFSRKRTSTAPCLRHRLENVSARCPRAQRKHTHARFATLLETRALLFSVESLLPRPS